MSDERKIRKVIQSRPVLEGAGVRLRRAFGFHDHTLFDPFLLLDDFRSHTPDDYVRGFPWHPHRGIETITYLLEGSVEHGDSLGHLGVIGAGDVQWMTAGSGIIHQEMPQGDEHGRMGGFQLWANLPAADKMMPPRYRDVRHDQIPLVTTPGGALVRVISGEVLGVKGPVQDVVTSPTYLDVTLPAGAEFIHPTPPGDTVLAYVINGQGCFSREQGPFAFDVEPEKYYEAKPCPYLVDGDLVIYADGKQVAIAAVEQPLRFLLMMGKPLREPVAWYGPIVMNTQAELRTAFDELENGTFIKEGKKG